jgi:hypothetical protein
MFWDVVIWLCFAFGCFLGLLYGKDRVILFANISGMLCLATAKMAAADGNMHIDQFTALFPLRSWIMTTGSSVGITLLLLGVLRIWLYYSPIRDRGIELGTLLGAWSGPRFIPIPSSSTRNRRPFSLLSKLKRMCRGRPWRSALLTAS